MKKKLIAILLCFAFILINQKTEAAIYVAIASTDWGTTTTWQVSADGGITWAAVASGKKPGSGDSAYIGGNGGFGSAPAAANVTVTISGTQSAKYCMIYHGSTLKSTVAASASMFTFRVYATLVNNGTFGVTGGDGISLELYTSPTSMTITGSGTTTIGRVRSNINSNGGVITIDQNMTLTGTGAALTLYYNTSGDVTTENPSLIINSGKTVTLTNSKGALHMASSVPGNDGQTPPTTNPSGNYTYTINGTLDLTQCTGDTSNLIPLYSSGTVTFNIAGTLKLANINTVNTGSYSGSLVINNTGNIYIAGNLINNATISGSGTTTFNGSSAQYISNTGTISNMVVNNSNMVYVNPGSGLNISTSLNTNNQLILASSAVGSGSIGNGGGTLSGNVTVQRYIGSNTQWRMIGFPLTAGITISASALAAFYGTGYNAYTYNEAADDETNYGNSGTTNAGWVPFTNTATIAANQGILMIGGTPTSTISVTGPLNSGTQSIPLTKSKNGWNFIANPFASNINWTSIVSNNGSLLNNAAIYRYDPNSTAYSSYINGSAAGALTQSNVIENGAGFFVQATTAGTLTIQESDKTTSAPAASLMGSNLARGSVAMDGIYGNTEDKSIISLSILKEGDIFADHLVLRWGVDPATDGFDGKYDAYDLGRKQGPDLSAVDNAGIKYSIFHGSALKTTDAENREIQLNVAQVTEGSYTISSQLLSPIANNNTIALLDHYNGTYTTLDNTNPSYTFNVTSDAASQSLKRFSLVFNPKATNTTVSSVLSVSLLNNPSTGNGFTLYSKENYNELQWQLIDNSGRSVQTGSINNVQNGGTYQVNTNASLQGMYFIKLIGDNKSLNSLKLIKE